MKLSRRQARTLLLLFPVLLLAIVEIAMRNPPKGTIVYARHPDKLVQFALDPGEHEIEGHGDLGTFHVSINKMGMRDEPRSVEKAPGTYRVAAFGDSFTYGYGVDANEHYVHHIQQTLNEASEQTIEVLNFGVPGYNLVQGVARLEVDGLKFQPDLVFFGLSDNDLLPRLPILGPGDATSLLAHFMIGRFILRRTTPMAETAESRTNGLNALRQLAKLANENDFDVVLAELIRPYVAGGPELSGHVRHFRPHVGTGPDANLSATALGKDLGFYTVPPAPEFSAIHSFASDGHPNPRGHQLIGQHIADAILDFPDLGLAVADPTHSEHAKEEHPDLR